MTIRELMEEQRRRVCASDPEERFAAALLLPAELAKRLRSQRSRLSPRKRSRRRPRNAPAARKIEAQLEKMRSQRSVAALYIAVVWTGLGDPGSGFPMAGSGIRRRLRIPGVFAHRTHS